MGDLARNPAGPGAVEMPSAPPTNVRPFETLVVFACATGLRPQEWQALEWQDVDVAGRHCRIRRTVGDGLVVSVAKMDGSLRRVSLQQRALDAFAELPRPLDGRLLVFPAAEGGIVERPRRRRCGTRSR